jgi:hypothetical protein
LDNEGRGTSSSGKASQHPDGRGRGLSIIRALQQPDSRLAAACGMISR